MTRFATFVLGSIFGAACVLLVAVIVWPTTASRDLERPDATAEALPIDAPSEILPALVEPPPAVPVPDSESPALGSPDFAVPEFEAVAPDDPTAIAMPPAVSTVPAAPRAMPSLLIPVTGVKPGALSDTFNDSRSGGRVHDAIDIMAARGTPVVAVDDGKIVKLFNSKQGGLTLYQFDRGETHAYYYAHLDSYAPGVLEGGQVRQGELIGYVGSTGNASPDAPHLHFAVFVLGPEKNWWQGTAINPYLLMQGR